MAKCKGEGRMAELHIGAGRPYTICPLCGSKQHYTMGDAYARKLGKHCIKAHQEKR